MKYWFTADEHYGHKNIIEYCNRPFTSVESMDNQIIDRHNKVVGDDDVVIHCGDFTLKDRNTARNYIRRLKGKHEFLVGSHDYWLNDQISIYPITSEVSTYALQGQVIWEKDINGIYVVACHYAMRTWPRSHHDSIQLHGHSHGTLPVAYNQLDVGVDSNNFYPVSMEQVLEKIKLINKLCPPIRKE